MIPTNLYKFSPTTQFYFYQILKRIKILCVGNNILLDFFCLWIVQMFYMVSLKLNFYIIYLPKIQKMYIYIHICCPDLQKILINTALVFLDTKTDNSKMLLDVTKTFKLNNNAFVLSFLKRTSKNVNNFSINFRWEF